jgi:hypothetical protein
MANTAALQEAIDWVRGELGCEYDVAFGKREMRLRTGRMRSFNAAASDGSVVATVMNSSGMTSGGKKPVGKIKGAIAEVYFLSLVDARQRLLVVTNASFVAYLQHELDGALVEGVQLRHLALPADLAARVAKVTSTASAEMGG